MPDSKVSIVKSFWCNYKINTRNPNKNYKSTAHGNPFRIDRWPDCGFFWFYFRNNRFVNKTADGLWRKNNVQTANKKHEKFQNPIRGKFGWFGRFSGRPLSPVEQNFYFVQLIILLLWAISSLNLPCRFHTFWTVLLQTYCNPFQTIFLSSSAHTFGSNCSESFCVSNRFELEFNKKSRPAACQQARRLIQDSCAYSLCIFSGSNSPGEIAATMLSSEILYRTLKTQQS